MAYKYTDKVVYIRETTDGKTKWVKIPGIKIRWGYSSVYVYLDPNEFKESDNKFRSEDIAFEGRLK